MTAVPILVDPDGPTVVSLRRHTEDDVERVYEQCVDPVSQAWTTVPVPYTRAMARDFVTGPMPAGWESDQEWAFAVDVDGRFGGTVSLRPQSTAGGEKRAEIAYGSHPDVRGTGAMERALRLLLGWGFGEQKLHTVIWWANRGNWASRRLAWRLGFSYDGTVQQWLPQRGEYLDAWVGALLSTDERLPRNRWLEPPVIEGERVRLRPVREDDTARVVETANDADTRHWVGAWETYPFGAEQALDGLLRHREAMALGSRLLFAVADPGTDLMLGDIAIFNIGPRLNSAEIGYTTHPDARGRGLTSAAVRAALGHAFADEEAGGLGLERMKAHAGVDNAASRAVLRKAGMREVGVERRGTRAGSGLVDAVLYEVLREELA